MVVVASKMEHGTIEYHIGETVRERHSFDRFHPKIAGGQCGRQGRCKATRFLNGFLVGVHAEHFVTTSQKIDQVAAGTAAHIDHPHSRGDSPPQELVEDVDVDLAELLVKWLQCI